MRERCVGFDGLLWDCKEPVTAFASFGGPEVPLCSRHLQFAIAHAKNYGFDLYALQSVE